MVIREAIQLDVWKGDWGLPSVDVQSLQFMTLLKISTAETKINKKSNPYFTPSGNLPVVHLKDRNIVQIEDLVRYLDEKNINPDFGLNKKQQAEIKAYSALIKEKLYPALQFLWWLDKNNETDVIAPWYRRTLPYPFNFYYPGKYKREAENMMSTLYEVYENDKDIESKIIGDAEKCITALSLRLGNSDFMFGAHPSSIDAIMYSYLGPLLKAPLRSTALQNHLKACTNLSKFVSKISQRYFSQDFNEFETKRKNDMKSQKEKAERDPTFRRNQFLAALLALAAMSGYAISTGLVQV